MKATDELIIVEETFETSIENVWKALTEIDLMRQWYFDNIPSFKPEVGFETQFNIVNEGRHFLHKWRVTEVELEKKLVYNWTFESFPGSSDAIFELTQENGSTKLRLTVDVKEDFPQDVPEFKRESCIAGWDYFLKQNLKAFLAKS